MAAMPPSVASAPGVDGEHEAGVAQGPRQLEAGDAGFHGRIEIRVADPQHAVHLAEIDADAAAQRVHVSFERGSGAKRHDRQLKTLADARDFRDLGGRGGEADDVGRGRGVIRLAVAVMFADGVGVRSARAEQRAQLASAAATAVDVCMSSV